MYIWNLIDSVREAVRHLCRTGAEAGRLIRKAVMGLSLEALTRIADAERRAEEILSEAKSRAEALTALSAAEAAEAVENARERARADSTALAEQAGQEADAAAETRRTETEAQCAALEQTAEGRMDRAVAYVLGRVVNG